MDNHASCQQQYSNDVTSFPLENSQPTEDCHSAFLRKDNDTQFNFDASATPDDSKEPRQQAGAANKPNLDQLRHLIQDLSKTLPDGCAPSDFTGPRGEDSASVSPMPKNPADMSSLQRAYFALQHQQMLQVQLIQKIQAQLSLKNKEKIDPAVSSELPGASDVFPDPQGLNTPETNEKPRDALNNLLQKFKPENDSLLPVDNRGTPHRVDPRDRPLSPTSKSDALEGQNSNTFQPPDLGTSNETSSLEKLQQTANHVLTKASQGIFTHHLIQDANTGEGRDSSHKHKCRYCGKVFGSDSGLQIHLRSHTGERPFKCNICGNRFTTRGNLKVHFQRHQSRFPHVKMNHNPVPEHLDKLCPPLLAQLGELEDTPPAPTGPPNPFSLPISAPPPPPPPQYNLSPPSPLALQQPLAASLLYRQMMEGNDSLNKRFSEIFRRSEDSPFSSEKEVPSCDPSLISDDSHKGIHFNNTSCDSDLDYHKQSFGAPKEDEASETTNSEKTVLDSKCEKEEDERGVLDSEISNDGSISPGSHASDIQVNKELLNIIQNRQREAPMTAFPGMRVPFNLPFLSAIGRNPNELSERLSHEGGFDVTKDPNLYANFLPRPGSNDNSWEALIEVQKASETMKLEQLVNNIENKLTDPNQCIICHRVLSCKSALQMHYRIHTGERPYKCKICSRTFTTKGNLKTHMSVHRARPPMRMHHQCPVCHKRYNNAMILQQHIRQHTGEPTDVSNEQIAAAEVQEAVPSSMQHLLFSSFQNYSRLPHLLPLVQQLRPNLLANQHLQQYQRDSEDKEDQMDADRDLMSGAASEFSPSQMEDSDDNQNRASPSQSPRPLDFSCSSPRNRDTNSDRSAPSPDRAFDENEKNSPDPRSSPQIASRPETSRPEASSIPIDLAIRPPPPPPIFPPFGLFTPPLMPNHLNPALHLDKSRFLTNMINIPGQGNTTCKICFKTLSCASALDIHYRSHSKDRPFVCSVCDRRFTTRGNMRQHMVTHKGHEDAIPSQGKSSKSRRSHSPKTLISLPPSSQLGSSAPHSKTSSTPSSAAPTMQGIPLNPALFPYPQFSGPLATLPGSIAALLGQRNAAHTHSLSEQMNPGSDSVRQELLNMKRGREGELQLPLSKRIPGADVASEDATMMSPTSSPRRSTSPSHPQSPDQRIKSSNSPDYNSSIIGATSLPLSPLPSHSISQLLTQPRNPPSASPPNQPLLVTS